MVSFPIFKFALLVALFINGTGALRIIVTPMSTVNSPTPVAWVPEASDPADLTLFDIRFVLGDRDVGLAKANIDVNAAQGVLAQEMVVFPRPGKFVLKAVAGPSFALIGSSNQVVVGPAGTITLTTSTPSPTSSFTTAPTSTSTSPSSSHRPSRKTSIIVGAVIGSLLLAIFLALLVLFLLRRRRAHIEEIEKRLSFHPDEMVQRRSKFFKRMSFRSSSGGASDRSTGGTDTRGGGMVETAGRRTGILGSIISPLPPPTILILCGAPVVLPPLPLPGSDTDVDVERRGPIVRFSDAQDTLAYQARTGSTPPPPVLRFPVPPPPSLAPPPPPTYQQDKGKNKRISSSLLPFSLSSFSPGPSSKGASKGASLLPTFSDHRISTQSSVNSHADIEERLERDLEATAEANPFGGLLGIGGGGGGSDAIGIPPKALVRALPAIPQGPAFSTNPFDSPRSSRVLLPAQVLAGDVGPSTSGAVLTGVFGRDRTGSSSSSDSSASTSSTVYAHSSSSSSAGSESDDGGVVVPNAVVQGAAARTGAGVTAKPKPKQPKRRPLPRITPLVLPSISPSSAPGSAPISQAAAPTPTPRTAGIRLLPPLPGSSGVSPALVPSSTPGVPRMTTTTATAPPPLAAVQTSAFPFSPVVGQQTVGATRAVPPTPTTGGPRTPIWGAPEGWEKWAKQ